MINADLRLLLKLMLYGSPYYGLNINVQILKAVHTLIAETKNFL